MANREEGAAAPNQRQRQDQPQHQGTAGQRHLHLNWSNFKPEFSGKPEEDAEAHYHIQMIGSMPTILMKIKSTNILSYSVRRSKIMISISRTLRRHNMASITEFI